MLFRSQPAPLSQNATTKLRFRAKQIKICLARLWGNSPMRHSKPGTQRDDGTGCRAVAPKSPMKWWAQDGGFGRAATKPARVRRAVRGIVRTMTAKVRPKMFGGTIAGGVAGNWPSRVRKRCWSSRMFSRSSVWYRIHLQAILTAPRFAGGRGNCFPGDNWQYYRSRDEAMAPVRRFYMLV